ncbi:M20/M25/M40 family metallo-hydrolase [Patulibacter sp. SYSU D01012]|uniref:M20/M25/M40 family metallo-hydrolase n=1 Tax=Patulibacter sp. SYSU D01012 TaxID=2817381 RepID=UPI001B3070EF|nr:M20/M25/M40 family metallo-hydrolase [Patulibacter sp. SYSU D01012]
MSPSATLQALLDAAPRVADDAGALLGPLVGVSSPSGDVAGHEVCVALVRDALPPAAVVERLPCSTTGDAPDLLVRLRGTGTARVVLLGHLDTVVSHERHRPLERDGDRWNGSGTFDMKGGDALAVGVLRALADVPGASTLFAEVALLLVADEEWRSEPFAHGPLFRDWDACLCFEGGERTAAGEEAVVVRRKAAAAIRVDARGRAAHAGSRPDDGRNALLALAAIAREIAAHHDPSGPDRLSAVPTILRSGAAINVVPDAGELVCDLRADDVAPIERVLAGLPTEVDGVAVAARFGRVWPGMDHRRQAAPVLERAGALLGRPVHGAARGGASDASHLAPWVRVAIDGLGPLGGGAHADDEHVDGATLGDRAAVALAVLGAVLAPA